MTAVVNPGAAWLTAASRRRPATTWGHYGKDVLPTPPPLVLDRPLPPDTSIELWVPCIEDWLQSPADVCRILGCRPALVASTRTIGQPQPEMQRANRTGPADKVDWVTTVRFLHRVAPLTVHPPITDRAVTAKRIVGRQVHRETVLRPLPAVSEGQAVEVTL